MAASFPVIYPSATLEAAGAFKASSAITVENKRHIGVFCSYTRGASGGSVRIIVEYRPDSENWFQTSLMSMASVTAGADSNHEIQRQHFTYTSTASGAETFIFWITDPTIAVSPNTEQIRIQAAELGVTGTPGTFSATLRIEP